MTGEPYPGFSDDAFEYVSSIHNELARAQDPSAVDLHLAAPADMTKEQLDAAALELQLHGWKACVATLGKEQDGPLGIRVNQARGLADNLSQHTQN